MTSADPAADASGADRRAVSMSRRDMAVAAALGAGALAALAPAAKAEPAAIESTFDRVQRTKTLRCGVVANGAPYYAKDIATGEWSGFYYELYKTLGNDFGFTLELHEIEWGAGVLELQSNKIDLFFGLTPTPRRALAIDFTDRAIGSASCAIVRPGLQIKDWADLNRPEIRLSTDAGSSHDLTASTLCPNAQILRFKSVAEASLAVQTGRADAQSCSNLLSLSILKKNPSIGKIYYPRPLFTASSAAGLRREPDKTFQSVLNYSLTYYHSFGLIQRLVLDNLKLVGLTPADWPAEIPI